MFLVSELIDTLWNVNPDQICKGLYQRQRINRYIMECKYKALTAYSPDTVGINRYIMECKCRCDLVWI